MPEAPVNDSGAVLYYEDTGAPEGSTDYLTVVLVHGLTFHGAVYNRLLPYAAQHNLRLVRINMRDYPRSSRYTPEELAAFSDPDVNVQAAAIKAHGEEIAAFIEYFIKKYDIPKIKCVDGRKTGGLALLTWSMSNILAFAFLGNARYFAKSTQDLLAQYLRTVVLHDPANSTLGQPAPDGVHHPLRELSKSLKERGEDFIPWVSYYFERVPDLDQVTPALLASRKAQQESPTPIDAPTTPTVYRMSPEELESLIDRETLERSSWLLLRVAREVLRENVLHSLLDTGGVWPDVKVLLVWCDETMHDCVWAAKTIVELARGPGAEKRQVDVERITGGNHFPHWDYPETVIKILANRV